MFKIQSLKILASCPEYHSCLSMNSTKTTKSEDVWPQVFPLPFTSIFRCLSHNCVHCKALSLYSLARAQSFSRVCDFHHYGCFLSLTTELKVHGLKWKTFAGSRKNASSIIFSPISLKGLCRILSLLLLCWGSINEKGSYISYVIAAVRTYIEKK